jgi:hypothetical protein
MFVTVLVHVIWEIIGSMLQSVQLESGEAFQQKLFQLGLKFSKSDLENLKSGDAILLEDKTLGEIGTALILLEALSSRSFRRQQITFSELSGSGIPICYGNETRHDCCLVLTLFKNRMAIKIAACNAEYSLS